LRETCLRRMCPTIEHGRDRGTHAGSSRYTKLAGPGFHLRPCSSKRRLLANRDVIDRRRWLAGGCPEAGRDATEFAHNVQRICASLYRDEQVECVAEIFDDEHPSLHVRGDQRRRYANDTTQALVAVEFLRRVVGGIREVFDEPGLRAAVGDDVGAICLCAWSGRQPHDGSHSGVWYQRHDGGAQFGVVVHSSCRSSQSTQRRRPGPLIMERRIRG
jgi:hypothetical protein